jgi:PAS domain S-box-containing protein/diguanylate cyclase (GGDEF)-like protein
MTSNETIAAVAQDSKKHARNESPLRLLMIEDRREDFDLCIAALQNAQMNIRAAQAETARDFEERVAGAEYDVILSNYRLAGWTGLDAFDMLQESGKEIPFILISDALGEERAVDCIKRGVADFVLKNHLSALPRAVVRAVEDKRIRDEHAAGERALRESERRFRVLADSIASAVLVYQGTRCQYANVSAHLLTGYTEEELLALSSWDLFHPESRSLLIEHGFSHLQEGPGKSRYEIKIVTKRGEIRSWDAAVGKTEISGQPAGIITAVDITERSLKEASRQGSVRDPLTGLLSVAQMQNAVRCEVKRSERSGRSFALLVLRLREMTEVEEQTRSLAENRALCKIANVVGAICRAGDVAFRDGPREFVLLLPETSAGGARQLTFRLAERLAAEEKESPLAVDGGIVVFPQGGPTLDHLLRAGRRNFRKLQSRATPQLAQSA